MFLLSVRLCLIKSGAKSKGQVVTGLVGTTLGASSHLMVREAGRAGHFDSIQGGDHSPLRNTLGIPGLSR